MEKWEKIPIDTPKDVQHITNMTFRKSYLWGLYSKTDSKLIMLTNGATYKLTEYSTVKNKLRRKKVK